MHETYPGHAYCTWFLFLLKTRRDTRPSPRTPVVRTRNTSRVLRGAWPSSRARPGEGRVEPVHAPKLHNALDRGSGALGYTEEHARAL